MAVPRWLRGADGLGPANDLEAGRGRCDRGISTSRPWARSGRACPCRSTRQNHSPWTRSMMCRSMKSQQRQAAWRNTSSLADLVGVEEAHDRLGLGPPFLVAVDDPAVAPFVEEPAVGVNPLIEHGPGDSHGRLADSRDRRLVLRSPRRPRRAASFPRCRGRRCSCRIAASTGRRRNDENDSSGDR